MQEVNLGQYALPVVLSVVLALIFRIPSISDRYKPVIAVVTGALLGIVGLIYKEGPYTVPFFMDYLFYGLMSGAAAVGLYEFQRAKRKPRS